MTGHEREMSINFSIISVTVAIAIRRAFVRFKLKGGRRGISLNKWLF